MLRETFRQDGSHFIQVATNFIHDLIFRAQLPHIKTSLVLAGVSVASDHPDTSSSWNEAMFNDQSTVAGASLEKMDEEHLKEFTRRQPIANVDVMGSEPDQLPALRKMLTVKQGGQHTEQEVSFDVQRLMMTGDFSNVGIKLEYSPGGLNVVYLVEPYFELKKVMVTGTHHLSTRAAESMFRSQTGRRMNLNLIFGTLARMEKWYFDQGKDMTFDILAVKEDRKKGVLVLKLAEMSLSDFKLTDMYRSMRTDIISMRILAAEKQSAVNESKS